MNQPALAMLTAQITGASMKRVITALALISFAACTPPARGPEDTVIALYQEATENVGQQRITPLDAIPMTDDLRALISRAEAATAARGEPFIEGDIIANCQDCISLGDVAVGAQTGPEAVPEVDGHRMVEARFTLNGSEPRAVLYDMVETPEGWRVDNILAEGFNLRSEADAYLAEVAASPAEPVSAPAP